MREKLFNVFYIPRFSFFYNKNHNHYTIKLHAVFSKQLSSGYRSYNDEHYGRLESEFGIQNLGI